uniref:Uncharacterized protein n=1 Tax=viral metagenome TaxID=1070528 RepID=A0A6C0H9D3_9ZZZZ
MECSLFYFFFNFYNLSNDNIYKLIPKYYILILNKYINILKLMENNINSYLKPKIVMDNNDTIEQSGIQEIYKRYNNYNDYNNKNPTDEYQIKK